jgi:acyl dehydratase
MYQPSPMTSEFQMSQDAINAFGALIGRRVPMLKRKPGTGHHADPAAAKSVGLRGPVAFSLHYYGHVSHLMAERFGSRWLEGGELSVAFIKPVCAGDEVIVKLGERPVQRPEADAGDRLALQVDVYNQLGELVAAGSASLAAQTSTRT